MTDHQSTGNGLAIAGFVVGIASLLFAFIPCLGAYSIYPGAVGVVLSSVGLYLIIKSKNSRGLAIAGLSVSLLAVFLGGFQYLTLKTTIDEASKSFQNIGSTFQQQLDSLEELEPGTMLEINEEIDSLFETENMELIDSINSFEQL